MAALKLNLRCRGLGQTEATPRATRKLCDRACGGQENSEARARSLLIVLSHSRCGFMQFEFCAYFL